MKILLMGGTGAIGSAIASLLAKDKENSIYITSRSKRENNDNIFYIMGNAKKLDFILPLLEKEKYDLVCDFMLYSIDEFKERLETLLSNTLKYVFFSSARVYAESSGLVDENSARLLDITNDQGYIDDFEYSLYKAAEENMLKESQYNNWLIVRPYKTYSKDRLQLGVFELEQWGNRVLRGKKVVFFKECMNKYTSMTHSCDTAQILLKVILSSTSNRQIYNIANPEQIKWEDVISIYNESFKKIGKQIKISYCDNYESFDCLFHNKYRIKYDGLLNRKFSDKKIQDEFGPFIWTSVYTGLQDCLDQYLETDANKKNTVNYSVEGFFDRITGEKESISKIPGIKNKFKYIFYRYLPYTKLKRKRI